MKIDTKEFVDGIVLRVRSELSAVTKRLDALEARQPERGEKGDPGEPGKPGDTPTIDLHDVVRELLACAETKEAIDLAAGGYVEKYLQAHPAPVGKDGRDGKDGNDGAPGKDGIGVTGALQDKSGHLIITTGDGRTHDVGLVAGVDGKNGADGANGRDGANGIDGADGLGFDDVQLDYDAETQEAVMRFVRGTRQKELRIPAPAFTHKGFYQPGQTFKTMNTTTHNGSLWIALRDTKAQPAYDSADWALAARKGADGNPAPAKVKHDR